MMMRARPISYLIIRQAGFTLAALQAFFNAMFGLGHPGKRGQRCLDPAIGEVRVDFHHLLLVSIPIATPPRPSPDGLPDAAAFAPPPDI